MNVCKLLLISFLPAVLVSACEQDMHNPINKDDALPLAVQRPEVTNLPGAATISYELPENKEGLLYVKAQCEIRPGVFREVKASYYTTSLTIDGFGESREYVVDLMTIGRNGKASDPLKVTIHPLIPPIWEAYESLQPAEDWGGISFAFENDDETDIVFEVLTKDSLDEWIPVDNFYTSRKEAKFSVRGFEAKKRTFGISVRDRWLNRTDTLVGEFTPWYEEKLDKSDWERVDLPTDYTVNHGGSHFEQIYDGVYTGNGWISKPDVDGSLGGGMPQWFTIDLKEQVRLSRLVVFYRGGAYLYQSGCPDEFEIWGSDDPNSDGSWDDSWTLLRECKTVKPSGLPHGQQTQEDAEYAANGDEFIFEDVPAVRYIRWKTLSNQAGSTHVNFVELDLYGQVTE